MAEPLKRPGEVIMKSRGGLADQLKALGPRKTTRKKVECQKGAKPHKPRKPLSRARLDKAEAALAVAEKRHAGDLAKLETERDAIERKISALQAKRAKELSRLKKTLAAARESYREALDRFGE